ncbi:MAG: glycosyltransferase, partial [Planctomycetota bacterium]
MSGALASKSAGFGRVAVIHDWLTGRRGAEKVLEEILKLCPGADVYTLVARKGVVPDVEATSKITTSWLNRLPGGRRYFQAFLPWFNRIARGWRLEGYDLVVSVSHCFAKNVVVPEGVPHLCYCQTPVRYAWELFDLYTEGLVGRGPGRIFRGAAVRIRDRWRREDVEGAGRVSRFVAISEYVRDRIERTYDRGAEVIHSPVDTELFASAGQ